MCLIKVVVKQDRIVTFETIPEIMKSFTRVAVEAKMDESSKFCPANIDT